MTFCLESEVIRPLESLECRINAQCFSLTNNFFINICCWAKTKTPWAILHLQPTCMAWAEILLLYQPGIRKEHCDNDIKRIAKFIFSSEVGQLRFLLRVFQHQSMSFGRNAKKYRIAMRTEAISHQLLKWNRKRFSSSIMILYHIVLY